MRFSILTPIFAPFYLTAAVIDLALNGNKPALTRILEREIDRDEREKGPRPGLSAEHS